MLKLVIRFWKHGVGLKKPETEMNSISGIMVEQVDVKYKCNRLFRHHDPIFDPIIGLFANTFYFE